MMSAKYQILIITFLATPIIAYDLRIQNITSYELADIVLTFEKSTGGYVSLLFINDSDFSQFDGLMLMKKMRSCASLQISTSRFGRLDGDFFWAFNGLNELILDKNGLESMDFLSGVSTSLRRLDVRGNNIRGLKGLGRFKWLQFLDVSSNKLQRLELNVNENFNLMELRASNNFIKNLEKDNFRYLKQLIRLDLSGNNIKQINNSTFSYLTILNVLNLSFCQIQILQPGGFYGLENLLKLSIDHNIIEEIPDISYLRRLQVFLSNDNKIQSLRNFGGLNLIEANLSNNTISKLIRSKANQKISVRKLSMQNCTNGQFLPKLLDIFQGVTTLDLSLNKLGIVKASTFDSSNNLQVMNLEHSFITDFEDNSFSALSKLQSLTLNKNNISILKDYKFKGLETLNTLNISDSQIQKLEEYTFSGLQYLQFLDLSFNHIEILMNNTFRNLTGLNVLNLQGNKIRVINTNHFKNNYLNYLHLTGIQIIEPKAFSNVMNLRELLISHSNIVLLKNQTFSNINGLQKITFQNSSIQKIDTGAISNNQELQCISFQDSTIKELAFKSFQGYNSIQSLNLSNSGIETLESGVFIELVQLEILDLSNNLLTVLKRKTFFGLTNLKILHLRGNSKLTSLEDFIFSTTHNLKQLSFTCQQCALNRNFFKELGELENLKLVSSVISFEADSFEPLKSLQIFELDNFETDKLVAGTLLGLKIPITNFRMMFGKTQKLTDQLFKGYDIKALNLSGFDLKSIHPNAFEGVIGTRFLDLSYNSLVEIRSHTFEGLDVLCQLNISNNRLITLHKNSFDGLNELEYLDISHNKLKIIPFGTLQIIPKLSFLNLSHNKIEHLELHTFSNLTLIRTLDVSYLNLTDLKEASIFPLENLVSLNIEGNGLIDVDFNTLMNYFKYMKYVYINGNKWSCEKLPMILSNFRKGSVNYFTKNIEQKPNVDGIYCIDKCSFIYC